MVNAKGCAANQTAQTYLGQLTLKITNDIRSDAVYDTDNAVNLFADYHYRDWSLALSNYRNTTGNSYSEDNAMSDYDIYAAIGYQKTVDQSTIKLSVGSRIAGDSEITTTQSTGDKGRFGQNQTTITQTETIKRKNDYFAGLNLNYLINTKQNLFGYAGYTLSREYDNSVSFCNADVYLRH